MIQQDTSAVMAIAEAIDEARVEPQIWPAALGKIARFLDARFAALIFEDRASASLELIYSTRAEKSWIAEYLRNHRKLDSVRARALSEIGVGRAFSSAEFATEERFRRSAVFQRWMEPHGLVDVLGAVLHRSPTGLCIFVALRGVEAGRVDAGAKARLTALLPDLARAVDAGRHGSSLRHAANLDEIFDELAAPILIVDPLLHISYANHSGEEMLLRHPALSNANGVLVIDDPRAHEALQSALRPHAGRSADSFAIMLHSGDERCCVMHVLPLSCGGGALFVRTLTPPANSGRGNASSIFGLTPRENSVLLAITEVGGVPATARALGLSEGTIKGYLKSIFLKTGAERQADLVKLVLGLESPFRATDRDSLFDQK